MSGNEVEELKERLTKVEVGFDSFKQYSAQVIKLELNPLSVKLDRFEKYFEKLFAQMETTQSRCVKHSGQFSQLEESVDNKIRLSEEKAKNRSLTSRLLIVSGQLSGVLALLGLVLKHFVLDK